MVAGPRTTSPSASRKVLPCQGQVTQSWRIAVGQRPAHVSAGGIDRLDGVTSAVSRIGTPAASTFRGVPSAGSATAHNLCPRVWSRGPGSVVDVDGLDEGEVSAEVTAVNKAAHHQSPIGRA